MSLTSKQIEELRAYAADRKGELAKLINDAADTIELLSIKLHASQMERSSQYYHGGWIPCSERLPEKAYGKYWVCTDTEYQCQCRWTDNVYGLGSSGEWAWKIFDIPQYSHVVAWMPLPEPWRGEEDEQHVR